MITSTRNTATTATDTQPAWTWWAEMRVTMPAMIPATSTQNSPLA